MYGQLLAYSPNFFRTNRPESILERDFLCKLCKGIFTMSISKFI